MRIQSKKTGNPERKLGLGQVPAIKEGGFLPLLGWLLQICFPSPRHADQNTWREWIISKKNARKFLRSLKFWIQFNNCISANFSSCLDFHQRFSWVKFYRFKVFFTKVDLIFSHKSFRWFLLLLVSMILRFHFTPQIIVFI